MCGRAAVAALLLGGSLIACRAEQGVSLGDITSVSAATGVGSAPSLALSSAGHHAVSWVSAPGGGADGRIYVSVDGSAPSVFADPLGPVQAHAEAPPQLAFDKQGSLYVLYVVVKDMGRRFPASALRLTRSDDNGKTWRAPTTVTDVGTDFGSHNFHSLTVAPDGTVYASWLDGREGETATYMTHSTDRGATWAPNLKISVGETCPCCHTTMAAGPHGVVYAAWRTVFPGNVRDIVVARSGDHGATWSTPVRVHADHWVYPGCPHAGPSIQLDASQRLHVLWWTGAPQDGGVRYASSTDGGATFSTPLAIAPQRVPIPVHVQLGVDDAGNLLATWDDAHGMASTITARLSTNHGASFGRPFAVSDSAHIAVRPTLVMADSTAVLAWSQLSSPAESPMAHEHSASEPMKMPMPTVGATQVFTREVRF